ncbi:MAG: hypothetical protein ND866_18920, partial [Pyrinomonadaceae bacterium]|nr:hypothetical protein [Pyrinomonadaceae bacterium]
HCDRLGASARRKGNAHHRTIYGCQWIRHTTQPEPVKTSRSNSTHRTICQMDPLLSTLASSQVFPVERQDPLATAVLSDESLTARVERLRLVLTGGSIGYPQTVLCVELQGLVLRVLIA